MGRNGNRQAAIGAKRSWQPLISTNKKKDSGKPVVSRQHKSPKAKKKQSLSNKGNSKNDVVDNISVVQDVNSLISITKKRAAKKPTVSRKVNSQKAKQKESLSNEKNSKHEMNDNIIVLQDVNSEKSKETDSEKSNEIDTEKSKETDYEKSNEIEIEKSNETDYEKSNEINSECIDDSTANEKLNSKQTGSVTDKRRKRTSNSIETQSESKRYNFNVRPPHRIDYKAI